MRKINVLKPIRHTKPSGLQTPQAQPSRKEMNPKQAEKIVNKSDKVSSVKDERKLPNKKVTKQVMSCKISNKINCIVHRKSTRNSGGTTIKDNKLEMLSPRKLRSGPMSIGKKNGVESASKVDQPKRPINSGVQTHQVSEKNNNKKKPTVSEKTEKNKPSTNENGKSLRSLERNNKESVSTKNSSTANLNPVTFKRSIRNFLKQEIGRKINVQQRNKLNSDTKNVNKPEQVGNKESLPVEKSNRLRLMKEKSSTPKSKESLSSERSTQVRQNKISNTPKSRSIGHPSSPMTTRSGSKQKLRHGWRNISSIVSASIQPKRVISNQKCKYDPPVKPTETVNNPTNVPNVILSTNSTKVSNGTNIPKHSECRNEEKSPSKCEETKKVCRNDEKSISNQSNDVGKSSMRNNKTLKDTVTKKEYSTRRSSFYNDHIVTRNLARNCKYSKGHFKNMLRQKALNYVSKMRTVSKKPMKPKGKVRNGSKSRPVTFPHRAINSINTKLEKRQLRPVTLPEKHVINTEVEKRQEVNQNKSKETEKVHNSGKKNQESTPAKTNAEMQKKMLTLMNNKFGPKSTKAKERSDHEDNFDSEFLEVVDDLAAVDQYVEAKILSFKLKENFIEIPHRTENKSSSVIIHRTSPEDSTKSVKIGKRKNNRFNVKRTRTVEKSQSKNKLREKKSSLLAIEHNSSRSAENARIDTNVDADTRITQASSPQLQTGEPTTTQKGQQDREVTKPNKTINERQQDKREVNGNPSKTSNSQQDKREVVGKPNKNNYESQQDNIEVIGKPNKTNNSITASTCIDKTKETSCDTAPKSNTRTKLPLTLKTKIVITNGKKVKKKLSHKEQRIYNLLRCYGNSTSGTPPPTQVRHTDDKQEEKEKSSKDGHSQPIESPKENQKRTKASPKKKSEVENDKGKKKVEKQKTSSDSVEKPQNIEKIIVEVESKAEKRKKTEDPKKCKEIDKPQENVKKTNVKLDNKVITTKEKAKEDGKVKEKKQEKVTSKQRGNSEDKNKLNKGNSPSSSQKSAEKEDVQVCSGKERRQQHKAKYNIVRKSTVSCKTNSGLENKMDKNKGSKTVKEVEDTENDSNENAVNEQDDKSVRDGKRKTLGDTPREKTAQHSKDKTPRSNIIESKNERSKKQSEKIKTSKETVVDKRNHSRKSDHKHGKTDLVKETQSSLDSSGIESDNECMGNDTYTDDSNEEITTQAKDQETNKPTLSDADSDSTVNSFLQKYKTSRKSTKRNSSTADANTTHRECSNSNKKQRKHSDNSFADVVNKKSKLSEANDTIRRRHALSSTSGKSLNKEEMKQVSSTTTSFKPSEPANKRPKNNSIEALRLTGSVDIHSDVDIFDDSREMSGLEKKSVERNESIQVRASSIGTNLSVESHHGDIHEPPPKPVNRNDRNKKHPEKSSEFKDIVNEHVNKYKTKDLVENLKQWTRMENEIKSHGVSSQCQKDGNVGNYRDYTTRTGIAHNPVRILKRKACEDLRKQLSNEYKNGYNGKDYFQCICFNKFFITRVKDKTTGQFDILNVKVKPYKTDCVVSLSDVQFCTFCSRLYEKYKNNFILINQEYIMKEFIQRHTKDWNKLNKSYDNEDSLLNTSNMGNFCNFSFASTTTTTPKSFESKTNSRTESRLDSISSDKNESINQGSDYSDYYLNEIFMHNMKKGDPSLASSYEFQRYKQKCRNVNLKINEICDLYRASSPRRISSETRSNITEDGHDDSVFMRPTNIIPRWAQSGTDKDSSISPEAMATNHLNASHHSRNSTPCKSQASQSKSQQSRLESRFENEKYDLNSSLPHTPRKSRHPNLLSDSMDEEDHMCVPRTPPKKLRTPNSFTCSRTPSSGRRSRKDHPYYRNKLERTKESFERLFNKVWRKCSPLSKGRKRCNEDTFRSKTKRARCEPRYSNYNAMYKHHATRNQSQLSSDVTDEYDADFSDSDGEQLNTSSVSHCYSCPSLRKKSSQYVEDNEVRNKSLENIVYKKEQYVNKLFIKQSSKHLFTNRKTSYSDSEQVIKIHNVKRKVYTTIHQKVYRTQDDLSVNEAQNDLSRWQLNRSVHKQRAPCSTCSPKKNTSHLESSKYRIDKNERKRKHSDSDSTHHAPREVSRTPMPNLDKASLQANVSLHDKIQEIQYENLWQKLVDKEQGDGKSKVTATESVETDDNDCVIETDNDDQQRTDTKGTDDSGIHSPVTNTQAISELPLPKTQTDASNSPSKQNTITLKINHKTYQPKTTLSEIAKKMDHSTRKFNNYEHTKKEIEKYAAVLNHGEPLNKQFILKLIKTLMKCNRVCFEDYQNCLKQLKVNVNLSERNEFLIKQIAEFSNKDEQVMKQCYEKLYGKYHHPQSELNTTLDQSAVNIRDADVTNTDLLETFESFKTNLNSEARVAVVVNSRLVLEDAGNENVEHLNVEVEERKESSVNSNEETTDEMGASIPNDRAEDRRNEEVANTNVVETENTEKSNKVENENAENLNEVENEIAENLNKVENEIDENLNEVENEIENPIVENENTENPNEVENENTNELENLNEVENENVEQSNEVENKNTGTPNEAENENTENLNKVENHIAENVANVIASSGFEFQIGLGETDLCFTDELDLTIHEIDGNEFNIQPESSEKSEMNTARELNTPPNEMNESNLIAKPELNTPLDEMNESNLIAKPELNTPLDEMNESNLIAKPELNTPLDEMNESNLIVKPELNTPLDEMNESNLIVKPELNTPLDEMNLETSSEVGN
ncbi:hypothetical protein M8J76_011358 [Diaphorina citri]|nr:hypothetical protein M8J76_011358 [Diaphorina citri]